MSDSKTLLQFLLDLLHDKQALAEFRDHPHAALQDAGLHHVCVDDIKELLPVVLEKVDPAKCAQYEDDCDNDRCHDDAPRHHEPAHHGHHDPHHHGHHHWAPEPHCDDDNKHHHHEDSEIDKVVTHLNYVTNNYTFIDNGHVTIFNTTIVDVWTSPADNHSTWHPGHHPEPGHHGPFDPFGGHGPFDPIFGGHGPVDPHGPNPFGHGPVDPHGPNPFDGGHGPVDPHSPIHLPGLPDLGHDLPVDHGLPHLPDLPQLPHDLPVNGSTFGTGDPNHGTSTLPTQQTGTPAPTGTTPPAGGSSTPTTTTTTTTTTTEQHPSSTTPQLGQHDSDHSGSNPAHTFSHPEDHAPVHTPDPTHLDPTHVHA
jgi:hypothetical protein